MAVKKKSNPAKQVSAKEDIKIAEMAAHHGIFGKRILDVFLPAATWDRT